MNWMLYGANGYSGQLIARAAVARGLRPVLAGRSRAPLEALARELGLESRVAGLDSPAALATALSGISLVLNCAGPFSATAGPMLAACLTTRAHYLDITGEIAVFERAEALGAEARAAGIVVCPGVGFDVVPTDCVALALKEALPGATHLALGFDNASPVSRGTARTVVEGLGAGGMVRRDGVLLPVPLGFKDRRIDFGAGEKLAMTIPWGDVSTAHRTTGIPNIEVYVPISPRSLARIRRLEHLRWALGFNLVQRVLKSRADRGVPGPDAALRDRTPTWVWGEARAADGAIRSARIVTANGYTLTAHSSVGVVARLLDGKAAAGTTTPARLMGSRYVETLPGSGRLTIS
ncbi:MAG TPA: saccharopine dehydrogenase NADP-binding domain-containing protein [Steroidobacteraceae bacterium]|nr:saccharopine dehydrogenase NADP-binding domain-containing protein [Steroidobacteraceae bacterium]